MRHLVYPQDVYLLVLEADQRGKQTVKVISIMRGGVTRYYGSQAWGRLPSGGDF